MLLGIDLGTGGVKALLVAEVGRVVGRAERPVTLSRLPGGAAEQDIEEIWQATLGAVTDLGHAADLGRVRAVGLSAQGGALQMLDAAGAPLGPVVSWLDGRGHAYGARVVEDLGQDWLLEHIGHGSAGLAVGHLARIREEQPGLWRAHGGVGFVGDVICGRLCGQRAHDATSLSLTLLYNPWLDAAEPVLLDRLGVEPKALPALLGAREPAGELLPEVARATGLPAGVPVSVAVHDQYAAALGCGAVRPGRVMLGAGTAWVLLAITDQLLPPVIPSGWVCRHPVPGLCGQLVSLGNGGSCVAWACETMGLSGLSSDEMDDLLAGVPAGSDGLLFRPLLAGGGARTGPGASGGLDGLRLAHTRGHVLRAAVEGLALELRRYLGFVRQAGVSVSRLIMCGRAAGSRVTPGVVAAVTGLPLDRAAHDDASAMGAAVLAHGLLEPDADLAELAESAAPPGRSVEPGPDVELYEPLFQRYVRSLRQPPDTEDA